MKPKQPIATLGKKEMNIGLKLKKTKTTKDAKNSTKENK